MSDHKITHEEHCGCGHNHHEHEHSHEEHCGCGHDHHEHEHSHEEHCGCGHDHHEHEHSHEEHCGCSHDHHEHEHSHEEISENPKQTESAKGKQRIYTVQNLGCAHCAAKMQDKISKLSGVNQCVLVYETKQLRVTGRNPDNLLPEMQKICESIEPGTKILTPESEQPEESHNSLIALIAGAVFFALGIILPIGLPKYACLFVSYAVLGWRVIWTAIKNITKGHVFDENFLMSLATIGAIAIGEYSEAVGVMLFYRIGEFFEDKAVERSRSQIMDAVDLRPEVVTLVTGNANETIPAEKAKVGDIILVRPGDRIPLDGEVIDGESRLDTSAVTGEPVPRHITVGDNVLSGCMNTDGVIKIRVTHILAESMVSRILDSVENAAARKPKLDRFITRFSRIYTPAVVIIAVLTAVIPSIITGNPQKWVYTALTFLVISCPCALVLSVPLTYFAGIGAGSKKGILFKGGVSLEALDTVKAVVMDKTGTITKGNFKVQSIVPMNEATETDLLALAAAAESASTHPIAKSILAAAKEKNVPHITINDISERAGEGIEGIVSGKEILCGNSKLMTRHGISLQGYTGSAGSTEVLLAADGNFLGHIIISDTIKDDAKNAISRMKAQRLKTAMLTGDGQDSADLIAAQTGIDEVHAKLLPEEKFDKLQDIRKKHGAVLFVGDGINDAPVLAGADVGAAMGNGADAAIEAADVVFMHADLSAVPDAIDLAHKTGVIAMQNIIFALCMKALVMVLGLFGIASMWLAVFADSGVAMLCVLNSIRLLYQK